MTATTETIRAMGFSPLACDIPQGMTLAEYRASRSRAGRRRVPRLRRRRR